MVAFMHVMLMDTLVRLSHTEASALLLLPLPQPKTFPFSFGKYCSAKTLKKALLQMELLPTTKPNLHVKALSSKLM